MDFTQFFTTQTFGHIAYTLIFFSFLTRSMTVLRGLSILAGTSSIIYNYKVANSPLWTPIQWNIVFMTINLFHICKYYYDQRNIKLNSEDQFLYDNVFSTLTRPQFLHLLSKGYTRTLPKNYNLIENDDEVDALFILKMGEADIYCNDEYINTLQRGRFIAEMSFLTGKSTTADVYMKNESRVHFWVKNDLKAFLSKNPELMHKFDAIIGAQLVDIIRSSNNNTKEKPKIRLAA